MSASDRPVDQRLLVTDRAFWFRVVVVLFRRGEVRVDLVSCAMASSVAVDDADQSVIVAVLGQLAALRRLIDGREVACLLRLEQLAEDDPRLNPEHVAAAATGRSVRAATRAAKRARAARFLSHLRPLVDAGEVSGEHLDAFIRALRSLDERLRPHLMAVEAELATAAATSTEDEFAERLATEVRRIEGDDGRSRLERQRRRTGLRCWTDRDGMWRLAGRYDPERALVLSQLLAAQAEVRFRMSHPPECPTDPLLAHEFLQALALADLMQGGSESSGSGAGGVEIIVTIDEQTWRDGRRRMGSRVECGRAFDVPIRSLHEIAAAGRARFVPVVLDSNGVVIRQGRPVPSFEQLCGSLERPVKLDRGRSSRFADRHQRRAMRAMYRRCAIPGCDRHVSDAQFHHVVFWEHGGTTDLRFLLPVCPHDHRRLHNEGWHLELRADRSLVVRRNGEVIMATGPPAEQWR